MHISSQVGIQVSEMLGIFLSVPANSWMSEATQLQSYLERNEVFSHERNPYLYYNKIVQ